MKKLLTLLCIVLVSSTTIAQKAKISSEKIALKLELPNYLKKLKTDSYEIQDDGSYWNYSPSPEYYPADEFPTIASLTDGVVIEGLESVKKDADLQILVGFLGNRLSVHNAMLSMKGTFSIMLFTKENKLLQNYTTNVTLSQAANTNKFPMATKNERIQTKARMLTIYAQKYLDMQQYLFNETTIHALPFGLFKKTKKGLAEAFNTESKPLIEAIVSKPMDVAALDKAIAYWKSQIAVDFGKKVKEKHKNKVIYVNLTSASILKGAYENALDYHNTAKKYAGFFDLWTLDYSNFFEKQNALAVLKSKELTTVALLPNTVYYITLDGGTYSYKDKKTVYSKIEIERFVPVKDSGMASLGSTLKPRIFIYENDVKWLRHFGSEHNKIITNDGKEIIFKTKKGAFRPFIKQGDGTYVLYENN